LGIRIFRDSEDGNGELHGEAREGLSIKVRDAGGEESEDGCRVKRPLTLIIETNILAAEQRRRA